MHSRPFALGLLVGILASISALGAEFQKLPAPYNVTTLAATEDGKTLILGHQNDDKLTVWDAATAKLIKEVDCPRPRHILVRGARAFVANYGPGTISVYSLPDWELSDELAVGNSSPVYLSAPQGKYFKEVIVACCGDGNGRDVKVIDAAKDRSADLQFLPFKPVYMSVATVDYAGKTIIVQGTVGHSISAGLEGWLDYRAAVSGQKVELKERQWSSMPILYQVAEGGHWFGGNQVCGVPPTLLNDKAEGNFIVPDSLRRACYLLAPGAIRAFALDGKFSSLGEQPATYADWPRMKEQNPFPNREHGNAVYYPQFAATLDGKLHVYALDEGTIYYCQTEPFQTPALAESTAPANEPGAPAPADAEEFPAQAIVGEKITHRLPGAAGAVWELTSDQNGVEISDAGELTWTPVRADVGPQTLKIKIKSQGKTSFVRLTTEVLASAAPPSPPAVAARRPGPGGIPIPGPPPSLPPPNPGPPPTLPAPPVGQPPELVDAAPLAEQVTVGDSVAHRLFEKPIAGARFVLEDAPAGAALSPAGVLQWTPTAAQVGEQAFKIRATIGRQVSFVRLHTNVIDMVTAAAESGDERALAELGVHALPNPQLFLAYGLNGGSVLVLNGDRLRVLDGSGVKVLQEGETERIYKAIFERPGYYVALSDSGVDLLDKTTLKTTREITLDYSQLVSLALHPSKPVCYVSANLGLDSDVGPDSEEVFEKQPVVEVQEETGESRTLDDVYGKWLATEPSGQFLYTGVWHIFKAGLDFNSTAGIIDTFGNVDLLFAYDIRGERPRKFAENKAPGRNGRGLVVSPDGKYISYVSAAGMETLRYEVPAFLSININTTYSHFKIEGFCEDVSYHPTLDLAASIDQNGAAAAIFKIKSGKRVTETYLPKTPLKEIKRVLFSPDGRRLLVAHNRAGIGAALESIPLTLTAEEQSALGRPATPAPPGASSPPLAALRTWTSADGVFTIEATLIGVEGDSVRLKRPTGAVISVPLSRLSDADQDFARSQKP